MKQLLILLLFFATQLQSQTLDSIFLKTGNIVTGKFIFAPTREYIHTASDYSKRIMANTTTKIVVDKVTYYTIPYLKKEEPIVCFAQEIHKGKISILEFDGIEAISGSSSDANRRKFYFMQNNKITIINENNLDGFYKLYLSDCFKSSENRNLEYNINNIISVLNNYWACKDPNNKVIKVKKIRFYQNTSLSVFGGTVKSNPTTYNSEDFLNYAGNFTFRKKVYGKGNSFGLGVDFEFIKGFKISLAYSTQKANYLAKDSTWIENNLSYRKKGTLYNDFSLKSSGLELVLSKFFKINSSLNIGVGVGIFGGKYYDNSLQYKYYEYTTFDPIFYKTYPIFNFGSLNPKINWGSVFNLQLLYSPVNANWGIFARTSYYSKSIGHENSIFISRNWDSNDWNSVLGIKYSINKNK